MINNDFYTTTKTKVTIPHILAAAILTCSLAVCIGGMSNASALSGWAGDRNDPVNQEKATNQTNNSTQESSSPTPTPGSASPSPTASAQPESGNSTDNASAAATSKTEFDWAPWILSGGAALIVAAGGAVWYLQRTRSRSQRSAKR